MSEYRNIDQHLLDLLNRGVDGELNAREQEELAALLENSAEAREYHEELKSFTNLMADVPELDPPGHLQESIERQIRLPVQDEVAEKRQSAIGAWLSAGWLRTGAALAAGVVLTITVYEMGSGPISDRDATNLVGTVVKHPLTGHGELLGQVRIEENALNGLVELRRSDDLFTLDVQLTAGAPGEFVLNFAGQELEFEGIVSIPEQGDAIALADGSVNVAVTGEHRYTMKFRPKAETRVQTAAPMELAFYANDHLVKEVELSISDQ
jgi:hypothetical protein